MINWISDKMGRKKEYMNTYTAALSKIGKFESEVSIRDLTLTIDEPERLGGTNKGPNPVEVLLASLAGCLDFTGTIVAKEMGYELENLEIEVEGDMDPRGVMGKADVPIGFQEIRVKFNDIDGIPKEDISDFLKEVENRCPVDNTLEEGVRIKIER